MRTNTKLALAALCLAAAGTTPAEAGWLTITSPPPSNQIDLGAGNTHQLTLPGVAGTASVTLNSATGTGRLLLRSWAFQNPASFSALPANGLDPNGADQYVVSDTGGSSNTVQVMFDFTGLAGGALPAGSVFTVHDLDDLEGLLNLAAFAPGTTNVQYVGPWLQLMAQFDADGDGSATNFPTFSLGGSGYTFTTTGLGDATMLYFRTTQPVGAVSFDGFSDNGPRGFGVAFAAVPEPSTFCLSGMAITALALVRRRRRAS